MRTVREIREEIERLEILAFETEQAANSERDNNPLFASRLLDRVESYRKDRLIAETRLAERLAIEEAMT